MGSATFCDRRSTRPTQRGPLAALIEFRAGFHRCLAGRADAAFELTTAALCAPAPVSSVPLLSLVPVFRRSHGSLYKALDRGRVNVDVTCWPRTGQRTGRWCSPWTPRPARVATPKPRPSAGSTIRRPNIRPASRPRPAGELLGHRHRQLGEHLRHRPRSQPALAWVIPSEVGEVYTPLTPESARTPRSSPTPNATSTTRSAGEGRRRSRVAFGRVGRVGREWAERQHMGIDLPRVSRTEIVILLMPLTCGRCTRCGPRLGFDSRVLSGASVNCRDMCVPITIKSDVNS